MKTFDLIVILFALGISCTAHADPSDECAKGAGLQMANCWKKYHDQEKRQMENVLSTIKNEFANDPEINKILNIQKLWEDYAKTECMAQVSLNGYWGGMQYQSCMYEKTKRRVDELDLHNCYENGCPERKSNNS